MKFLSKVFSGLLVTAFLANSVLAITLKSYVEEINTYIVKGLYDSAIKRANTALTGYPTSSELYALRGGAYMIKEQYKQAYADLNKAIEYDENNKDAYILRSFLKYLYYNSPQGAYIDAARCVEIDPNYGPCYSARGIIRMMPELNDLEGGLDDVQKGFNMEISDVEMLKAGNDLLDSTRGLMSFMKNDSHDMDKFDKSLNDFSNKLDKFVDKATDYTNNNK